MPLSFGKKMALSGLKMFVVAAICAALVSCAVLEEELKKFGEAGDKEKIGTGVGGVIGYQLGAIFGKGNKYSKEIKVLGALAGAYYGRNFGKRLDEQDLARMALSTQQAIANGKDSSWNNPENKTSGQARVVATETKPEPIKVKVLKSKVKQVPPLDIIGSTYIAKGSNVRGGPSTEYVVVGSLAAEQAVKVIGKVKTRNWMMIAENGVGSGFVSASLLVPAPATEVEESGSVNAADVEEQEVATERVCRSIENTISMPDGTTEQETITACQGPNGWEVQPIAS